MIHKSGFTLIEIMVVVVLLSLLAVIVVPNISGAGVETRVSAMATDLRRVRSQIELYRFHHDEKLPATTGEDAADFIRRMTTKTDAAGEAGADFGPYLQSVPVNPFNDLATIRMDGIAAGANTHGWRFNTVTGIFEVDDSADHAAF